MQIFSEQVNVALSFIPPYPTALLLLWFSLPDFPEKKSRKNSKWREKGEQ